MATKLKIVEPSFRMGCGRYIQEAGALTQAGAEAARLSHGVKKIFVMGGPKAFELTREKLDASFRAAGLEPEYYVYEGFCNPGHCDRIRASAQFAGAGLVVGVGGGNLMDSAKYCAMSEGLPLLNIPTSSATCAACTPLSVMYDDRGGYIESRHWPVEVGGVIVDMDVIRTEPQRLLVSGVFDAVAKLPELSQRLGGKKEDDIDIGLMSSAMLSEYLYRRLFELLPAACDDLNAGRDTKALYDIVYLTIGLTGVVSGLARGTNQSALAHKIYETSRTIFPREIYPYLHGEIVAIGIIVQKMYNAGGDVTEAERFRDTLRHYGMMASLTEAGVPAGADSVEKYYEKISCSSAMVGTTDEEKALLKRAIAMVL